MKNFEYYNPVRVIFGKGTISKLDNYVPKNAKILLCYGGGSIMRNGVYDQVISALGDRHYIEYGGIMPNPEMEFLLPAIEIVKKDKLDYVLAVGGGSVVDAVKFIAAGAEYKGEDSWDILAKGEAVHSAIPFGVILTLPATGTEMNGNSVITKKATHDKLAFSSPMVFPQFSILDPEVTYSLPKKQVVNGVIDAYVHVMEQYLTYPAQAMVQDSYAESLLLILKKEGPKAYCEQEPDYANRANIMWTATNALNTQLSMGVPSDWATHTIGHELTALHGLDHAVTLAIVLPGVMHATKEVRKEKMLQYAENIWGLSGFDHVAVIDEAIRKTENFFNALGVETRLSEYQIGQETINLIMDRLNKRGLEYVGNSRDIPVAQVRDILESRF